MVKTIRETPGMDARSIMSNIIYNAPDSRLLNYLNASISNAASKLGNIATNMMDSVVSIYDKFNSAEAINQGKLLLNSIGQHLSDDAIYTVSHNDLYNANLIMQRYIIANPVVNQLVADNMCVGFSDTYIDLEPGVTGTERYDYRRVMDGVLDYDDDGVGVIRYYSQDDEDIYGDELNVIDKFSILETWENVAYAIANEIDPTSYDGSEL